MVLYLKLEGKPCWFNRWNDDLPIWDKRDKAREYHTEELIRDDYNALKDLGCKVLMVRDLRKHQDY